MSSQIGQQSQLEQSYTLHKERHISDTDVLKTQTAPPPGWTSQSTIDQAYEEKLSKQKIEAETPPMSLCYKIVAWFLYVISFTLINIFPKQTDKLLEESNSQQDSKLTLEITKDKFFIEEDQSKKNQSHMVQAANPFEEIQEEHENEEAELNQTEVQPENESENDVQNHSQITVQKYSQAGENEGPQSRRSSDEIDVSGILDDFNEELGQPQTQIPTSLNNDKPKSRMSELEDVLSEHTQLSRSSSSIKNSRRDSNFINSAATQTPQNKQKTPMADRIQKFESSAITAPTKKLPPGAVSYTNPIQKNLANVTSSSPQSLSIATQTTEKNNFTSSSPLPTSPTLSSPTSSLTSPTTSTPNSPTVDTKPKKFTLFRKDPEASAKKNAEQDKKKVEKQQKEDKKKVEKQQKAAEKASSQSPKSEKRTVSSSDLVGRVSSGSPEGKEKFSIKRSLSNLVRKKEKDVLKL